MKILSLDQLGQCHPSVRAQLEKHLLGGTSPKVIEVETLDQVRALHGPIRTVRNAQPEQEAGALLVQWIDLLTLPNGLKPGLFFAHVTNAGVAGGKVRGGILQGQGVRKGWPDYILDLPLGRYHGMRLELKADDGSKPTQDQLDTLARLESVGFYCRVAWGFEEAKHAVEQYLAFSP